MYERQPRVLSVLTRGSRAREILVRVVLLSFTLTRFFIRMSYKSRDATQTRRGDVVRVDVSPRGDYRQDGVTNVHQREA